MFKLHIYENTNYYHDTQLTDFFSLLLFCDFNLFLALIKNYTSNSFKTDSMNICSF